MLFGDGATLTLDFIFYQFRCKLFEYLGNVSTLIIAHRCGRYATERDGMAYFLKFHPENGGIGSRVLGCLALFAPVHVSRLMCAN